MDYVLRKTKQRRDTLRWALSRIVEHAFGQSPQAGALRAEAANANADTGAIRQETCMKTAARILGALALVGIVGFAGLVLFGQQTEDASSSLKSNALNALVDASGIKDTVQSELDAHLDEIASAAGLSLSEAQEAVDALDVNSWTVADLPADASATATYSTAAIGVDAEVTLYDDPGYVTVETYGQTLTFAVPESAQDYASLIAALS